MNDTYIRIENVTRKQNCSLYKKKKLSLGSLVSMILRRQFLISKGLYSYLYGIINENNENDVDEYLIQ